MFHTDKPKSLSVFFCPKKFLRLFGKISFYVVEENIRKVWHFRKLSVEGSKGEKYFCDFLPKMAKTLYAKCSKGKGKKF